MRIRVGQGLDIHPFSSNRKLVLGGVHIEGHAGLSGHSDADALTHAICDALLGALALGDMGQYFSDQDPKYKDKPSLFFLKEVMKMVRERGWNIINVDTTVLTEEPKLKPYTEKMRETLAQTMNVEKDQVSIKATRSEKLGALGRKEGLMALAIVFIEKITA